MAIRKSLNLTLIVLLTDIIHNGVISVVKIMNRIEMIKAAAEKGEIRKAIGNVAIRKKSIKEEMKLLYC